MMKLCDLAFLTVIALCLLSLVGCSDRSELLPVIVARPVLRSWTAQEECDLAALLAGYPSDSIMWTLHDDWARMRREDGFTPPKEHKKCTQEKSTGPALIS